MELGTYVTDFLLIVLCIGTTSHFAMVHKALAELKAQIEELKK